MSDLSITGAASPGGESIEQKRKRLAGMAKSGADWFLWIAGLSAVNSVTIMLGDESSLLYGLGITLVMDVLARQGGLWGKWLVLAVNVPITVLFAWFGLAARRRRRGAFWAGIILYALDGLIFFAGEDWLGFGFHLLALFFLWQGLAATNRLRELESTPPPPAPTTPAVP